MIQCYRANCHLTALWQIGLDIKLRYMSADVPPVKFWTSIVCCGLCADEIPLEYLKDICKPALDELSWGNPDMLHVDLRLDDISDGYWRDPVKSITGRVPIP